MKRHCINKPAKQLKATQLSDSTRAFSHQLSAISQNWLGLFATQGSILARCVPIAIALAVSVLGSIALAEDWPVVRGNTLGTGVASGELPEKLELLWKYPSEKDGGFQATAVVVGGIIYVGDDVGTFHAVRLSDGQPVWTKKFDDSGFDAGAAFDKDRLYVGDMTGIFRCLAIADGEEKWQANLDAEIHAGATPLGTSILVTSEAGTLTSLSMVDGTQQWPPFHIEAPLRCTPTVSGGRAMLAGCDSLLHIIDVADGHEVATVKIDAPTGSTAAMLGERVYFGTEGGTFFAIDVPASPDKEPEVAWTYRDPERGQSIRSAAAVTDKFVVYGSQAKAIYCLDATTGDFKWKVPTRTRVDSSPVIAGERVIAATTGGKLYVLDLASGKELWSYDAGGSFAASPAIVDGRILIGNTNGTLYCFGANADTKQLTTEDTKNTNASRQD